jgi:2,3-bisphosphoglycerate-independent phosphoglycerate mutase
MYEGLIEQLAIENTSKIVLLVMDGLGGMQMQNYQGTELELAKKPNLDALAQNGASGLLMPIMPGVTTGSGPGHFALFGYDPVQGNIGRGVLSAAGLEFDLIDKDVAGRVNFATIDAQGNITDRRAGRIDTETNQRICELLRQTIKLPKPYKFFLVTEKEHRALLVLRGPSLAGDLDDTDPQITGVPPLPVKAQNPKAKKAAALFNDFLKQARKALASESQANMLLLRGFAKHHPYPSMNQRYKLRCLCLANYPMYRGVAKLVGMKLYPVVKSFAEQIDALEKTFEQYDFFFMHVKTTDATGEDGNFAAKMKAIEEVDALIPRLTALRPEVLAITGDHSTPSALRSHSWHPVPLVIWSKNARYDGSRNFCEKSCQTGGLGRVYSKDLMGLVLAHALRLKKFGA